LSCRLQDYCQGGEREHLLEEIATLRDQLIEVLDAKARNDPDIRSSISRVSARSKKAVWLLQTRSWIRLTELEHLRRNLNWLLLSRLYVLGMNAFVKEAEYGL
jgi:hypothetical protein